MHKEAAYIIVLIIFSSLIVAIMNDSVRLDNDIVNMKKSSSSEIADDFDYRYEVIRFTLKNYYPDTTRFNLTVIGNYSTGDPMLDTCPGKEGKFCVSNGSMTLKYPSRIYVEPHSFEQLIMDIGVRDDADEGRYRMAIIVMYDNETYAKQSFTINVGEESFAYGKTDMEEDSRDTIRYLAFFGFLCGILVLGLIILSKGKYS